MTGSLNDAAQETGANADLKSDDFNPFERDPAKVAKTLPEPLTAHPSSVFETRKQMRKFER